MVEAGAGDADECALFHPKRAGGGGADDRAPVRAALDELRAAPAGDTQDAFLADFVAGRRWAAPDAIARRPSATPTMPPTPTPTPTRSKLRTTSA